jgi:F-type H+-transporting ATPase subunit epsilon
MSEQYEKTFDLEILTPDKVAFTGTVTYVKAPGSEGYFGILANHAPLLAALTVGELEIETEGKRRFFAISGGFLEVLKNRVRILAETVEESTEIDVKRAAAALERAQKRLQAPTPDIDIDRARAAYLRAANRLKVASRK